MADDVAPEQKRKHEAAQRRAIAALEEMWDDEVQCPACHSHDWEVGEPMRLLTTVDVLIRMHPVGCAACGLTMFVRADKVEANAGG